MQFNEQCCLWKNNGKLRIDVSFASNKKDYLKWTSKLSYVSHKIFGNDLVGIGKNKFRLTLKKPVYIGTCILELSKILMQEFHYDYIKNNGNKSRILFTDTDNSMYEIKTEDVYKDFTNDKEMFHLSQNFMIIQTN